MCEPIIRLILMLALLLLIVPLSVGQASNPALPRAATRPVKKLPRRATTTAEIQLLDFKFQQTFISREGPALWPIEGEPLKGAQYIVEALLYGEDAIATASFEVVDGRGVLIQPVRIVQQSNAYGHHEFYGLMVAPDRPFRVVVTGKGIDGKPYRSTHARLFRPKARPAAGSRMPSATREQLRLTEEMTQQAVARLEEDLKKLSGGVIVMPRQRVSNVTYAPFFSPSGRPLGVRVNYDVEFSQDGYYNPELHVFPVYDNEEWRSRIDMRVLNGSIAPQPAEESSPQVRPNILAYGAGYRYKKGTTYHFTAEMVPDYVVQNEAKTKFCLYDQKFKYADQKVLAVWAAIRASQTPISYTVHIKNSDFHGIIENFYSLGAFYKSFVAEGARDCGEQPTIRF